MSDENYKYVFTVTYYPLDFQGQRRNKCITQVIRANNKEDFLKEIYEYGKEYMVQKIDFENIDGTRTGKWGNRPELKNLKDFIVLEEKIKTVSKPVLNVNDELLRTWSTSKEKKILVFVYKYSSKLKSIEDFDLAKEFLINELAKCLQDTSPICSEGNNQDPWEICAKYIIKSTPTQPELGAVG